MATTAPAQAKTIDMPTPTNMPRGVRMSHYWRPDPSSPSSAPVQRQAIALPHDDNHYLVGELYQCLLGDCDTYAWVFPPAAAPADPFCARDGQPLQKTPLVPTDADPIAGARWRRIAQLRQDWAQAAQRRADAVKADLEAKAHATYADYRNHLPLAGVAAGLFVGNILLVNLDRPLLTAAVGVTVATAGAVVAYIAAYLLERRHVLVCDEGTERAKREARARAVSLRWALGAVAAGGFSMLTAATGMDPVSPLTAVAVLVAALLTWATCHQPWAEISRRRDNQREAAHLAAIAREKAEADRLAAAASAAEEKVAEVIEPPVDEDDPKVRGERMAQQWAEISRSEFAQTSFPAMRHTWIVVEKTEPVEVPLDGELARFGWQYLVASKPGALAAVADGSTKPPIVAARGWLASMLEISPERIEIIDQPDGLVNRALLIILDSNRTALAGLVPWRGKGGVRRERNGAILAFDGRSLKGDDVYESLYVPKQLSGGLTVGNPGNGKTGGTITKIFNLIVAGGLPTLFDPKELVDYADFVGLFPIGVTAEHREVIMRSRTKERERRQKVMARRRREDQQRTLAIRKGLRVETRPGDIPGAFNTDLDGLLWGAFWEEFHMLGSDTKFIPWFNTELRLERAVAMYDRAITQGGGLQDMKDSVLRGILQQLSLEVYRMPMSQARLAGYNGTFDPEKLPRIPGVCLRSAPGAPETPMRMAYISPDPEDEGNLYDLLLDEDGNFKIEIAPIPEPMLEVLKAEGLIDLWNLGKGSSGLDKLLAGTEAVVEHVTPEQAAGMVGKDEIEAKYVILAIVHDNPGCTRRFVHDHPAWITQTGRTRKPDPATITRALQVLTGFKGTERDESLPVLLNKGPEDAPAWRVTEAGTELARKWSAELARRAPKQQPPASAGADQATIIAQDADLAAEMAMQARWDAKQATVDA